jgi:hypothetical protein
MSREDRTRELQGLRRACPERLIALYRSASNMGELDPLPSGLSMPRIIQGIVEHEERVRSSFASKDPIRLPICRTERP